jgi:hypothetical protein
MPYDTNIGDIKNTQITLEEEDKNLSQKETIAKLPDPMKDSKHHCIDYVNVLSVKDVIDLYLITMIEGEFLGKGVKNHRLCVQQQRN